VPSFKSVLSKPKRASKSERRCSSLVAEDETKTTYIRTNGRYVHINDVRLCAQLIKNQQYKQVLGDNFEIHTAFSREGPNKVYVQHKLKENAAEVNKLLEQKAYFYVCGDAANMAREVNTLLGQIIAEQRGIPEKKAEDIVKAMRSSNQYQEDVWS